MGYAIGVFMFSKKIAIDQDVMVEVKQISIKKPGMTGIFLKNPSVSEFENALDRATFNEFSCIYIVGAVPKEISIGYADLWINNEEKIKKLNYKKEDNVLFVKFPKGKKKKTNATILEFKR
jgi:hypothetical protein